MTELLIQVLEAFGLPVFLHGTLGENEPFPAAFFTFITIDSPDAFPFDDTPTHTAWEYQVIFYSNDPRQVEQLKAQSRQALKAAGFIPQGKGRDIPSEEPTHTGWLCNYLYLSEY